MQQLSGARKRLALALLLIGLTMGCASTGGPVTMVLPPAPAAQSEYIVQPGDTLEIKFYYHSDHNIQDIIVRPDGKLLLPLVGEQQAAGLTPAQLAGELAQRYSTNLRDPRISVNVKAMNQAQVYVGGEVLRPGIVKLKPQMNVLQAILEAGGPRGDTADIERVVLLRSTGDNQFGYREINIKKFLANEASPNPEVLSQDDMIFIPQTGIAKANVWVDQYIRRMLPFGLPLRPPAIQ